MLKREDLRKNAAIAGIEARGTVLVVTSGSLVGQGQDLRRRTQGGRLRPVTSINLDLGALLARTPPPGTV
jgi:hypothetical protein